VMSTVLEMRRDGAVDGQAGDALEPKEAALSEIKAAMDRANREAHEKRREANGLLRRLVEVESGGAGVRRRQGRVQGFVLSEGTRIYGIEEAAN
jgi:hypothetical protein